MNDEIKVGDLPVDVVIRRAPLTAVLRPNNALAHTWLREFAHGGDALWAVLGSKVNMFACDSSEVDGVLEALAGAGFNVELQEIAL